MTKIRPIAIMLLILAAGCADPVPPAARTPHNGTLVSLPEGKGFIEVVTQPAAGQDGQAQVAFYFLGPDRKAMASAPAAAKLKAEGKAAKPIDLGPGPDGSLITPPMADAGEMSGTLSATIDGKEVSVPIAIR